MSRYPKPSVTVDIVVFSILEDELKVLLIKRGKPPFEGRWALPGGFIGINEPLEAAARRELQEETGLRITYLEQLYTFGEPGRDPRGRTISVAHYTVVRADQAAPKAASDAAAVHWFSAFHPPRLAFDHHRILRFAVRRLQHQLEWTTVGFEFLPRRFSLAELQRVYEIIWRRPLEKRTFRKKLLSLVELVEADETRAGRSNRPARFYTVRRRLTKQGF